MNLFFSHMNPQLIQVEEEQELEDKPKHLKCLLLQPETVLTLVYSNNIDILIKGGDSKVTVIFNYLRTNEFHQR